MEALDVLANRYWFLTSQSAIRNVDPNRGGSDVAVFVGFPTWDWTPDPALVAERTALRQELEEWLALFGLLHRHRLPETASRIEEAQDLLRRWLDREGGDHSIPASLDKAAAKVDATFAELRALVDLADDETAEMLAVPDTNVLLNDPDVATYQFDPDVPDDRTLAGALDLQARLPAATVVLVARDLNLQTKAAAVAMPFAEPD